MRIFSKKQRSLAIMASLITLSAVILFGMSGCGDPTYKNDYMGTSEYDVLMREAMQRRDTRYMAEEYLQ